MATGTDKDNVRILIKWITEKANDLHVEAVRDSDGNIIKACFALDEPKPRRTLVDDPRRTRPI